MKVLFLCTGNSARSVMAEAIARRLGLDAHSAGSHPTGRVNPIALHVLARHGIDIEGLRSKSWDDFGETRFDLVVTVCANARGEVCPVRRGDPETFHWEIDDPVTAAEFEATFLELRARIEALAPHPPRATGIH